ncbi:zinc-dependent alcohol dehydrogenase family protein [Paenibacillus polysaccharolyticus]|uniref:zinc-dependent alcohol dehydrogenase family protein n=1 Tax=Paenibacillus polysaccharolyticus TaxID=582692 RepID=UPI00209F1DCE|nr:zinc-dependent alcohol dehydrogenase family protein [Paenibacillus polysaccharolyticus]MCP1131881.1 zinc-dependent alcohol dehydrogenase family protein [Paenibacillus polysaccharolyticus]
MKAKVIRYYRFGEPTEVLHLEEKEVLSPGPGELTVRMSLRPINPSDLIPIRGAYPHRTSLPAIPGFEGVGVVESIGSGVSHHMLGRRVLPLKGENTWQEMVKTEARYAVIVPDDISDSSACQIYINPITAWLICTSILHLTYGNTLIVNAGGSAIGRIFAQLSRIIGFRMIALTRNDRHTSDLHRLGADLIVNTTKELLQERIMEFTEGRGADAAVDCIGGTDGEQLVSCLRPHGTVISVGLLSGVTPLWHEVTRETQVQVKLFWLKHWVERCSQEEWEQVFRDVLQLVKAGRLIMADIGAKFDLTNVQQAIVTYESESDIKGKVLLKSF